MAFSPASAGVAPIELKEIELMLRSGFGQTEIAQEVKRRGLLEPLTPATATRLRAAGATPELVDFCSQHVLDSAAARAAAAADAERKVRVEEGRKAEAQRLAQSAALRTPTSSTSGFINAWQSDLVSLSGGRLSPFPESPSDKQFIALYFSAGWCQPCRRFTPLLVDAYNRMKQLKPEFEVVFISHDRTPEDMIAYMSETGMKFPAIAPDKLNADHPLAKYGGSGIPRFVLLDKDGRILADSYVNEEYIGPQPVLAALAKELGLEMDFE